MKNITKFVETVNFRGLIMVGALVIGTLIMGITLALAISSNSVEREINAIHDQLVELDKDAYRANIKLGVLLESKQEIETKIGLVKNHLSSQSDKYKSLEKKLAEVTKNQGL